MVSISGFPLNFLNASNLARRMPAAKTMANEMAATEIDSRTGDQKSSVILPFSGYIQLVSLF
ncbi:Uncharacterised protein [Mycobacteroides abscessus subsp. abscessus]|nr:Uncharacterised protein [Mycobacteroides abscessus subsp. abscessus]